MLGFRDLKIFLRRNFQKGYLTIIPRAHLVGYNVYNHKNYNFLDCDWFKKLLFFTNSLAKLLSDSLSLDLRNRKHIPCFYRVLV